MLRPSTPRKISYKKGREEVCVIVILMSCKCAFQYVENVETMVRKVFFFSEKSKKESQDHHEIGK